jgi:integrase
MTRRHPELPERVFPKGRWYYLVTAEGKKRVWKKLTLIRDGLPALYRKLADEHARDVAPDRIPALVTTWLDEVSSTRSAKTQENDRWVMGLIAEAFAEFRAREVTTPACIAFLARWKKRPDDWSDAEAGPWRKQPRTYNLMRAGLRELMRFAEEKESGGVPFRDPGTNPVTSIKTMPTPARDRYPTDSELRRVKVAAFYGKDGKRTRTGATLAALIDLAYLTGQRIGDLLELRWNKRAATDESGAVVAPYIAQEGIYFKPDKTAGTTGAKVLITWTPKLKATVDRIEAIGRRNIRFVITSQEAQRYEYQAFRTAWWRAVKRAGIKDLHFHDLRAKAITDTEERHGMQAARRKGAHSTEQQTATYTRHRKAQKSEATR